jgi:hypothetical protein
MKTAEQILREYVPFDDVNGDKMVKLFPLTIIDIMDEYLGQFVKKIQYELAFWERVRLYEEKFGRERERHEDGATCSIWYAYDENQYKSHEKLDNAGIPKIGIKYKLRKRKINKANLQNG